MLSLLSGVFVLLWSPFSSSSSKCFFSRGVFTFWLETHFDFLRIQNKWKHNKWKYLSSHVCHDPSAISLLMTYYSWGSISPTIKVTLGYNGFSPDCTSPPYPQCQLQASHLSSTFRRLSHALEPNALPPTQQFGLPSDMHTTSNLSSAFGKHEFGRAANFRFHLFFLAFRYFSCWDLLIVWCATFGCEMYCCGIFNPSHFQLNNNWKYFKTFIWWDPLHWEFCG